MSRNKIWLGFGLVAALGTGAWYVQALSTDHALSARHLPPVPDLKGWPDALPEGIAAAGLRARSWTHAAQGLADLSRQYHANGFYTEALLCYAGLRQIEPRNARWPHLQASILANFGRMDEALPLRQQAVALAPDYLPARLRLADVLLKSNRTAEAAQAYGEVLRRQPGEPYALLGLARCDLAANDWTKAQARLQEAVAKHPDFIGAHSLLVTVSEHLGDRATAESSKAAMSMQVFSDLPDPWLDELSEVCFDPYQLSVAASTANFAGHRPAALDLIDRAIALAPDNSTYRRQAGQYLLDDRNFGAAKLQLEKAVELSPGDSDCWLRLLEALRGLGQSQALVSALLKGLSHCPQSSGLHLEYARWLKTANRMDEAIAEFRYGYQLRPTEAAPLIELATTYLALGRTADAVAALNQALERQPDHPSALATLAYIAINGGDEAGARHRLAQLRQQNRITPELLNGLYQAYQQQFGRSPP